MNKVDTGLIDLLSSSINCSPSSNVELLPQEWQQLFDEAVAHQIHHIIFEQAYKNGSTVNPDLFAAWKNETMSSFLFFYERFEVIGELFERLRKANIPVLALKGLYFKNLYPKPELRTMGDMDLLIDRQYLDEASKIIQGVGYQKATKEDPKHISFFHKRYIYIELHTSLVTETRRKQAIGLNQDIWNDVTYFTAENMAYLIPSDFNHLLYCCIHMTNHFGKGGFGLRQLSDFALLLKKAANTLDWDKFLEKANEYGIGNFVEALLIICNNFFKIEIPQSIIEKNIVNQKHIEKLMDTILEAGVFGGKNLNSSINRSLAMDALYTKGDTSKFSLRYIFPSRSKMSSSYGYAKKYGFLLPVAWVHRLIRAFRRKDLSLSQKIPDTEKIDEYISLFRWLDIK